MPQIIGVGPLLSPWVGMWELVWQAPETGIALAGLSLMMAGTAITIIRWTQRDADAGVQVAVVRAPRQQRPGRRHRRAA